MKYSLRSLMIVVVFLPPFLAVGWAAVASFIAPGEKADSNSGTPEQFHEAMKQYEKHLEIHP